MSAVTQANPEQLTQVLEALRKDLDRISGVLSALGDSAAQPVTGGPASQRGTEEAAFEDPRGVLSQREAEVFDYLVSGDALTGIAASLHISEHTVRNHVKAIYRKLGVNSRVQLICRFSEASLRSV